MGCLSQANISPPRIHFGVAVIAGGVNFFVGRPGFYGCWLTSGAPGLVLVQGHYIVVDLRGGAIFPHPMEWSIFAATRLSFQVRNGTGRFPCAMPPAKLVVHTLPTHRLLVAAR